MSINTASTPDGQGVLIFNGESIIVYSQAVTVTFEKNSNAVLSGKKVGSVFLTSHRIIYLPDQQGQFASFEMPFSAMSDVTVEQPIFGANYIRGVATAQAGSGLAGEIPWRLTFPKGGCIEFAHALLRAVDLAAEGRPMNAPPPYAPPAGAFYAAPPDYFAPTSEQQPLIPPSSAFPDRPQNVFMQEAPPPYSGVGPDRAPHPTEQLVRAGESIAPPAYQAEGTELRRRH